jgi:phosphoglycerate-specific signal transduction histidine kinase
METIMKLSLEYLKNMLEMRTKLFESMRCDLEHAMDEIDKRDHTIACLERINTGLAESNSALYRQNDTFRERIDELNEDKRFMKAQINDLIETKYQLRIQLAELKEQAEWWRTQDADEDYIASLEVAALPDNISFENNSIKPNENLDDAPFQWKHEEEA